ncbi:MAG: ROK family transcriptional regulator [Actinomycetota bacterium]
MSDGVAPSRAPRSARQTNRHAILRALHLHGATSRSELVQSTGLTRSAVGSLVGDLAALGLVEEAGSTRRDGPGRPSSAVRPRGTQVVIAVDLMVDSIGVAAVALGGAVVRSIRWPRRRTAQPPHEVIDDALRGIERVTATLDDDVEVRGLGVAVPGLISPDDHRVLLAPNLGWVDVDLVAPFRARLGDLPVVVGNDGDVGALAEVRRGSAIGHDHVLYVTSEVGVGAGIIAGGELVTGSAGIAGEVGHTPVNPAGRRCSCGAIGCLETEIGEHALLLRAGRTIDEGRQGIADLLRDAAAGDAAVIEALREHTVWVAFGLTGMVHLLNVDVVVLGGLLGEVMPFVHDQLAEELNARLLPSMRGTAVVAAALGEDAPVIGAAERIWDVVIAELIAG